MLSAWRCWHWAEHEHSAPRPMGTAWEVQKQQHVKGTNKVWSRDRWIGVPCNPAGDRLSQQQWGGKSFEPKRETHTHGLTRLQTRQGTHWDLHKHEQDCSWGEKAKFKESKGWVGQQSKNPRFKKYTAHFRKCAKAAFTGVLHQWQEGTPKCPKLLQNSLSFFKILSQRRDYKTL